MEQEQEKNNEKQHKLDLRYMRMATIWAENSYCQRRKVGALIVKNKMIISDGYNGISICRHNFSRLYFALQFFTVITA